MANLLLISVIVIATCGLIYELIAGTAASYLLGDSVTQFSTVIGCYLFAMGIGSWLTRYMTKNLLVYFVRVEILTGAIGGVSAITLFMLFNHVASFRVLLYTLVGLIGILVGIEIPLLLRILKDRFEFKDLVSKVLAFDYIGALFASILFPLVLVPYLGLVKSGFLFGMLNVAVAVWVLYALEDEIAGAQAHKAAAIMVLIGLTFGFVYSEKLVSFAEASTFPGRVIYSDSTPYQRIVLTKSGPDVRLFLNSNLQFSSLDEYRYHEALVHPAMSSAKSRDNILVIGGGDGLALREVLKYDDVKKVTLVDLDPAMTDLFKSSDILTELNQSSLSSPKLDVVNKDAFIWLREAEGTTYDVIIIDVPDPSNYSVGKLYSKTFFTQLKTLLDDDSIVVVQSTSPLYARKAFWCVDNTMAASGLKTAAYHAYVPSFGEWGFIIGTLNDYTPPAAYPAGLKFLTPEAAQNMFYFPPDMAKVETKIQKLDDQVLVRYFEEEWSRYTN